MSLTDIWIIGIILRCLNRPIFNGNEFLLYSWQQTTAVHYSFCKVLKRKCSQMKILKLLSLRKFIKHPMIFFSNFCDQNWTFDRRTRHQSSLYKKVVQRWFFAISWIGCILNYPINDNCNMSLTHCENSRQIAHTICGVGTSKSRSNLCKFTI